jgi:hypothetical protein
MITMVVFVFVIAAVSQIFTGLLTQFKQQSKIAETNIEGIVGLDMLRRDVERAGYGIPWILPATAAAYNEVDLPNTTPGYAYNQCAGACTTAPRPVVVGNNAGYNGSDELVIRAANVANNTPAQAWTILSAGDLKTNGLSGEAFDDTDKVIVLSPGNSAANARTLVVSSADDTLWSTTYDATADFDPDDATQTFVVYGIDGSAIRMPFNRTDYYISDSNPPSRCADNTGVLLKSVLSQATGNRTGFLPLLDCVADMQVVFRLDTTVPPDGLSEVTTDNITGLTAEQVRTQLMDIRVYILAHEGQRDPNFTYTPTTANTVTVGEFGAGRNFNFTTVANPIPNWQNYRWKIYTIVVTPKNLKQ